MNVYTFSDARQNLKSVLDEAQKRGAVRIRHRDGRVFEICPVVEERSALDVAAVPLGLTQTEILSALREVRDR